MGGKSFFLERIKKIRPLRIFQTPRFSKSFFSFLLFLFSLLILKMIQASPTTATLFWLVFYSASTLYLGTTVLLKCLTKPWMPHETHPRVLFMPLVLLLFLVSSFYSLSTFVCKTSSAKLSKQVLVFR